MPMPNDVNMPFRFRVEAKLVATWCFGPPSFFKLDPIVNSPLHILGQCFQHASIGMLFFEFHFTAPDMLSAVKNLLL